MGKREAYVEKYLVAGAQNMGAIQRKVQWIGRRKAADQILAKNGRICFIECKAEGEKPDQGQRRELCRWREQGFLACAINTRAAADIVLAWLAGVGPHPRVVDDLVI